MQVVSIPVKELFCDNEFNCRGHIPAHDVISLAKSIAENGLQQPIVVQPWTDKPGKNFRIISGHRRYTAHLINNAETISAIVKTDLNPMTAKKLNLEENLKRKDLNILQEAQALTDFVLAGWSVDLIAKEIGMPIGWVKVRQTLLKLPHEIQQEAAAGFLTQEHIKQIGSLKSPTSQFEAVKKIKNARMSGDKRAITVVEKKPSNILKKRQRSKAEIFKFQEMVQDVVGPSFATRCLAWAAGEISEFDLLKDFKTFARENGVFWSIPNDVLNRINLS